MNKLIIYCDKIEDRIKERIEFLESQIYYNDFPGVHTYTQCSCGRTSCRAGTCSLCMNEELKLKLQEQKA